MNKFLRQLSLLALLLLAVNVTGGAYFYRSTWPPVTVPDTVDRVVVLQHQTLNLLVQMNATDKIVGVMANWKQQLGDGYARLAPELAQKASLGDQRTLILKNWWRCARRWCLSRITLRRR